MKRILICGATGFIGKNLIIRLNELSNVKISTFIRGDDKKHLLMVEYDDLVNSSDETMRRIYEFLELDYYQHDFGNVENKHREIDDQWYLKDMHHVRKEVKKKSKKPEDVLSPYILNRYKKLEYWKYPNSPYLTNGNN